MGTQERDGNGEPRLIPQDDVGGAAILLASGRDAAYR